MENPTQNKDNNNERIVAFVKEHKVLYDKSMRAYKNNNIRNKLWDQLASTLNMDVKSITTRWRSLRDRYVKEMKIADLHHRSGAEAIDEDVEQWELMEHMSFLKDHVCPRKTTSNYVDTNAASSSQHTDFHEMVEEHLEEQQQTTEAPLQTPSSTRKRKADEIDHKMSSLLDRYIANADGKHTAFGQLVAHKLSYFSTEIANRVEAQILNVIYSATEEYRAEVTDKD
ncbi:transcription factor Adf-1-like isoform X2 [Armigeres subalbatus]|uniref:transcription factor Adf-1-like isoform X2 n=1 Tax=Armigeres subalbatus TaxID=124917 RepID=UPI002ED67781